MKRVLTSAVAATSTAQSRAICSTRVAHQVQRPDLMFETNGASFADLSSPATSFGNSMYSKYRPSAPPADLAHTDVDSGLGTSARDPYTVTINNIPTTAPPMNVGNAVSFDQTGPVSMVMSPNTLSVGGSNSLQASAVANSKRQLTQDEIEALGKGAYTLSEWIGVRPQLSTVDVSATSNPAATANNGLLRVYIENFLKIEAPVPVSSLTYSFISDFETAGIENMCLSAGRADTAVVTETWKSIAKKFPNSTTSSEADLFFFNPEGFLSQVESLQREALLYLANLSPSSFSSNVSKDTPTDELLASAPEDAVRAIKGLVSIAIEARNEAIDTNIVSVVTNAQFFDEGNAVWRVLLNTFDGDKRQIFINASTGDASKEAVDPLADSPQLAEFDWVMSHDRPLPRVTAPVCLLFLLAALRAVKGSPTSAATALSSQQATALLDASSRQNVPKMSTLSRLSLVDDNIRAQIVAQALDRMFGNNAISSLGVDAATPKKQQIRSRQSVVEGVAVADPKKFVDHLRAAGFDVSVLQQVELMAVESQQKRDAEASRSKTVAGTSDVGAPVTATSGDASKSKDGKQQSSSSEQEASSTNSTVVLNTNISKAMKAQITPLISLFVNGKGVSAAFQELYRVLSGGAVGTPVLTNVSNTELLHHISGVLGFGPKTENIASVFNQNSPKFASFWAANYKVYAEAILSDVRLLGALTAIIARMLQGNANLSEGIVSKESRRALDLHLKAVGRDDAEETERATLIREALLAPHNVSRVVDALAKAGADVSSLFNLNNERALIHQAGGPSKRQGASSESLVDALLASGGDRSAVHQVGTMVIARHPHWASAGVIPPKGEFFTADNIVAIAAHVFVRLSYVPHTALALMKRNYRGRIGDIFLPDTTATSEDGTPVAQPRHHNLPIELGKVEHYDTHLYKRNDPQGWYQRMRDIHNRNVSVKIAMADLRTVSDDFARPQSTFGESASSSSSSSSPASSSEYNTNSESGKQVYFGTQHERRLRVLAGERVGMNIIKLDSDRYEDADDNEKYGLVKLQQLLSESKKVELGKAYWPSVEVKVRYPSGQSRSMQSLIDYARNEAQSKELYEQYREIKKTALFVSPMDLYLKDRSEAAAISNSSARTSMTSEGYVVGVE